MNVKISARHCDIDACSEEVDTDECADKRNYDVQSALDIFVPGFLGSVVKPARYHLGKDCQKAESQTCYDVACLKKGFVRCDGVEEKAQNGRYDQENKCEVESYACGFADVYL